MRTILLRVYQIRSVRGKPTDAWVFEYLGIWVFESWRRELSTPAAVPWRGVAPCFRLSQLRSYPPCLRHTDVLLHTVFVSVFLFLPIPVSGTQRCVIVLLTTLNLTKMCALTISVSGTTLYYWVSQATAVLLPTVSLAHAWKAHILLHRIYTQLYFNP